MGSSDSDLAGITPAASGFVAALVAFSFPFRVVDGGFGVIFAGRGGTLVSTDS
jgi:hypothetical protein